MFSLEITYRKNTPHQQIRELRAEGLSVASIVKRTGSTPAIVRRIVGKLDPNKAKAHRQKQEAIALRIDAEPLTFKEKVTKWTAETGQSDATFWRVVQRAKAGCTTPTAPDGTPEPN